MTAERKATYGLAVAYATAIELWACDRFVNPRPDLGVFVFRGRRWRSDTEARTTRAELEADQYTFKHRIEHKEPS